MIALKILSKILKALRSNESPNQIAWGFVFGMILGLTPLWNLHNLLLVVLIVILKVNAAMAVAGFFIFSLFAFIFDPLFHQLGFWLLTDVTWLQPVWLFFAKTPVLAWSNYNNTLVIGSLIISLFLITPTFYMAKVGVMQYREKFESRVKKLKIVQILAGSKLYRLFQKLSHLGE